ncbi:MAG: hypothetical protein ROO71_09295 [Balneola sp.]
MKSKFFILTLFLCLMTLSVSAQVLEKMNNRTNDVKISFNFIPDYNHQFQIKPLQVKTNKVLVGTGFMLQGLKFRSPVDQFNAVAPFDFRAYEPLHFSSFSLTIQTNYLLQNPIQLIK